MIIFLGLFFTVDGGKGLSLGAVAWLTLRHDGIE